MPWCGIPTESRINLEKAVSRKKAQKTQSKYLGLYATEHEPNGFNIFTHYNILIFVPFVPFCGNELPNLGYINIFVQLYLCFGKIPYHLFIAFENTIL